MDKIVTPIEIESFNSSESFTYGNNIDNTNKVERESTPQAFSNYTLKQHQDAKRIELLRYKLPAGEQVYAFYKTEDGDICQVTTDTILEMVDLLNSILEWDVVTPQRIVQANKPSTLYDNQYISNVITYYTDKSKSKGYRFIVAYKSIWESYTDTKKKNRLKKL